MGGGGGSKAVNPPAQDVKSGAGHGRLADWRRDVFGEFEPGPASKRSGTLRARYRKGARSIPMMMDERWALLRSGWLSCRRNRTISRRKRAAARLFRHQIVFSSVFYWLCWIILQFYIPLIRASLLRLGLGFAQVVIPRDGDAFIWTGTPPAAEYCQVKDGAVGSSASCLTYVYLIQMPLLLLHLAQ